MIFILNYLYPYHSLDQVTLGSYHPFIDNKSINKRDDKADMLVKLYLSFFSFSRAIKLAKRISPSLFASITDPMSDVHKFSEVRDWLRGLIRKLANRYLSQALSRPLYQGISWEPTWKALPTDRKRPGQSRRERGILHQSDSGSLCSVYRCLLTQHSH